MTKEQINEEFEALVGPQVDKTAVRQLNAIVENIELLGSWPENATPKPLEKLWT